MPLEPAVSKAGGGRSGPSRINARGGGPAVPQGLDFGWGSSPTPSSCRWAHMRDPAWCVPGSLHPGAPADFRDSLRGEEGAEA